MNIVKKPQSFCGNLAPYTFLAVYTSLYTGVCLCLCVCKQFMDGWMDGVCVCQHHMYPHAVFLSPQIRTFMTQMHDHLLQNHHSELLNCGMEACSNFEHVVETSLQQCILRPLSMHVYLRLEEHLMENSSLFQVQRSVHQGKFRTPQEMGIRVSGDECEGERWSGDECEWERWSGGDWERWG